MESNLKIIETNPTISLDEILAVEDRLSVRFPDQYRDFLLRYNGGKVYYNSFDRYLENGDTVNYSIDYLESLQTLEQAMVNLIEYEDFVNAMIIPVAQTLGSTLITIGIGDSNFGQVFVFDWDFGATFQAQSFQEFIRQIKYDPDGESYPLF
ncbi:MAG: SMI1/KNR4 family protein [Thioploca sp.]|nr:SMI1/KNR4 family protein [Thioploca sp.]